MVRVLAAFLLSALVASSGLSCCAVAGFATEPREFFSGTTYFARATALSENEFLVSSVFLGDIVPGRKITTEAIVITVSTDCIPKPVKGLEYLIAGGDNDRSIPRYVPWPPAPQFLEFLNRRHVVTSAALLDRLKEWRANRLPSDVLLAWLYNADTKTPMYGGYGSLLVRALGDLEFLVYATDAAESCNPELWQALRGPVALSLANTIRILPRADEGPPLERDIGNPRRDRYNPAERGLQNWEVAVWRGLRYQAIRECWNRQVTSGEKLRPTRLLSERSPY